MPSAGNFLAKSPNVCRSSGRTLVVVPLTVLSTVTSICEPISSAKRSAKSNTLPSVCFAAKGTRVARTLPSADATAP